MVKIPPRKRRIARAQAQALAAERERERERDAEHVAKRAKREVKENAEQKVDLASVPKFEGAQSPEPRALGTQSSRVQPLEMRSPDRFFKNERKPKYTPLEGLKKVYPADFFNDVMKPRRTPRILYAGDCGIPAVYVVCFAKISPFTSHETGILSTYPTVEAANIQVMSFFEAEAPWLLLNHRDERGIMPIKKMPGFKRLESISYWLDMDNCLTMYGEDEDMRYTVYASRQVVKKDGLSGPCLDSSKPQPRMTSEEWGLSKHLYKGYRRAI
ncbi:hypothetical protein F4806DRAFT_467702 [Annulohypoxylon nitens]|nr:hypothetical protein F4806DRAFT_467702 [Annulohypoxylon nitens]